jgi:carboxylesterase type B
VVVTLNYRLSVFGLLSLGTKEVPGNARMKDQVMALKWIQKNIEKFGGDKHLVTLFGSSAGAISITSHMVSPMSANLFHRAIVMSGSVTMISKVQKIINDEKRLRKIFNCLNSDILNCLAKVNI